MSAPEFAPELVEQTARALHSVWQIRPVHWESETDEARRFFTDMAAAVLTAVAPILRAEGAAESRAHWQGMHDDAMGQLRLAIRERDEARAKCAGLSDLAGDHKASAETAYQRGMVTGARQVWVAVDKYAARDHLPSVAIGARGAHSVAREAVARIEGGV